MDYNEYYEMKVKWFWKYNIVMKMCIWNNVKMKWNLFDCLLENKLFFEFYYNFEIESFYCYKIVNL